MKEDVLDNSGNGRPGGIVEGNFAAFSVTRINRLVLTDNQYFPFRFYEGQRVIAVQYGNQVKYLEEEPICFPGSLGSYKITAKGIHADPNNNISMNTIDVMVLWVYYRNSVSPYIAAFGYLS